LAYAYQDQVLNAGREVEDSIVAFLRTQEQARYLDASVVAAARTVEITNEQYNQGAIDFTPVFLFQETLTEQQDAFAAAQGDIAQSLIGVYRALGGGWQIRLGNCAAAQQQMFNPPVIDEQLPAPPPEVQQVPFESFFPPSDP
jgi:outer membrane protein TolC